jgi:hypothetical protein
MLLFSWLLAHASYGAALAVYLFAGIGIWLALASRVLPSSRTAIVAAAAPAALVNIIIGQNGFVTAGLAGFALLSLNCRPILAGVLVGLLVVKPQLAMLFPIALVAASSWRTIASAAATVTLLCAGSALAFGPQMWIAFWHSLGTSQWLIDSGAVTWGQIPTAYIAALSLGAPRAMAEGLQAISAIAATTCVWRAWRNPDAPFEAKAAVLLVGSLMVSPYLSYYDLTWVALAVGFIAKLGWREGFFRGEREIMLFGWLTPVLMVPAWNLSAIQIGFPMLVLLLVTAVQRSRRGSTLARADDRARKFWLLPDIATR